MTVVEVLVAILILAVVSSGLALAVAGGSGLERASKVQTSLGERGQKIYEHFVANRSWMDSCTAACDLSPMVDSDDRHEDDLDTDLIIEVKGQRYRPTSAAGATSSEDYFKLSVMVSVKPEDSARLGKPHPFAVNGIISRSGEVAEGSVKVEICAAQNQIDERMSISGCTPDGTPIRMGTCPTTDCAELAAVSSGFPSPDPTGPSPFVIVKRQTTITPTLTNGTATRTGSAVSGQPGVYEFKGVPAGTWAVTTPDSATLAPDSRPIARWKTHDNPSTGRVTIEPNRQAQALVMYGPSATGSIQFNLFRIIHKYRLVHKPPTSTTPIDNLATEDFEADSSAVLPDDPVDLPPRPAACPGGLFGSLSCLFEKSTTGFKYEIRDDCAGVWGCGHKNCFDMLRTNLKTTWRWDWDSDRWNKVSSSSTPVADPPYWCSTYTVKLDWDYYAPEHFETPADNPEVPGASGPVAVRVKPAPTFRKVWYDTAVTTDAAGSVERPTTPKADQFLDTSPSVPAAPASRSVTSITLDGIPAGLNGRLETHTGGATSKAIEVKDIGTQAAPFTWVNPVTGVVRGPGGEAQSPIKLVGDGECIWNGPGYTNQEGECNLCYPYWDGKGALPDTCTIVVGLTWTKTVHFYWRGKTSGLFKEVPKSGALPVTMANPLACAGFLERCRPAADLSVEPTTHTVGANHDGPGGTSHTPRNSPSALNIVGS